MSGTDSSKAVTVLSPTLPHTPTNRSLGATPEMVTHALPYMGMITESMGPTTPLQTYGGWVGGTTPGSDGSHPLQRALLLQNQYSQVREGVYHVVLPYM